MTRSRDQRRHHHQRMINKVRNFPHIRKMAEWFGTAESREQHILRMAETRTPCSCFMCGNPRRKLKQKTLKERKIDLTLKEELDENL